LASSEEERALTTVLIILLIAVTGVLVAVMVVRPGLTATRGGKVMAFLVLFALPGLCVGMGGAAQFEHSKARNSASRATSWSLMGAAFA
jgi:hypothetical protein